MNEDIDFYNKASRSEGSSDDDEDDIDEESEKSQHLAAEAGKKGSVDPDLAGDSG